MAQIIMYFVFICSLFSNGFCGFPCRLQWVKVAVGDSVPDNSVYVSRNIAIARETKLNTVGNYVLSENGLFTKPWNLQGNSHLTFEILTNPFGCVVSWENNAEAREMLENPCEFCGIARTFVNGTWLIPSQSLQSSGDLWKTAFHYLRTEDTGFHIKISDYIYDNALPIRNPVEALNFEFIGMDVLDNQTPVEYTHTIEQSRIITESSKEVNSTFTSQTDITSVEVDNYPTITTNTTGKTIGSGTKNSISTSSTTEIKVTRTLAIPAYMAIEVCSSTAILDTKLNYNASAVVSIPGYSGQEVKELLGKSRLNLKVKAVEADEVHCTLSGIKQVVYQLDTQVFIWEMGSGCTILRNAVAKWRQFREAQFVHDFDVHFTVLESHFKRYFK